jgi:hypothetical protein
MSQTGVCVCSCAYRRHNPVRNHFPWSMRAMARQGPASSLLYTCTLRKTLAFAKMRINISRDMLLHGAGLSDVSLHTTPHHTLNSIIIALRNWRITQSLDRRSQTLQVP